MRSNALKFAPSVVLGASLYAGLAAFAAGNPDHNAIFCKAIGLPDEVQAYCTRQLNEARDDDERKMTEILWVTRSAVALKNHPGSLFQPPVDDNYFNGLPGTPYQSKAAFIPNQVALEIRRALKAANLD